MFCVIVLCKFKGELILFVLGFSRDGAKQTMLKLCLYSLWHRVVWEVDTNVSEQYVISIFKVHTEDWEDTFLRNVYIDLQDYTMSQT